MNRHLKIGISFLVLTSAIVFAFQNCSKGQFGASNSNLQAPDDLVLSAGGCSFGGGVVANGKSIIAFQNSTVPSGSCIGEERVCTDGVLSGSYLYTSCTVGGKAACLFKGQQIAHGSTIPEVFQSSGVPFGSNCVSESRSCDDGVLSGSFQHDKCTVGLPNSCIFNNQTIPHDPTGQSTTPVYAWKVPSVAFGQSCEPQKERLFCNNGSLSGTARNPTCLVGQPVGCNYADSARNGAVTVMGHNDFKDNVFRSATVPFGNSCNSVPKARITCRNGVLDNPDYRASSCTVQNKPACGTGSEYSVSAGQCTSCGTGEFAGKPKWSQGSQSCVSQCNQGLSIQIAWVALDSNHPQYLKQIGFSAFDGFKITRNGVSYDVGYITQSRTFYDRMQLAVSQNLGINGYMAAFKAALDEVPELRDIQVTNEGRTFDAIISTSYEGPVNKTYNTINLVGSGNLELTRWTIKTPIAQPSALTSSFVSCY